MLYAAAGPVARASELSCKQAAAVAEAREGIPAGLLLAIGVAESGRTDSSGHRTAWPWTVQASGIGHFLAGADQAVAVVRELRAGGIRSIDIGCFQINLLYHPSAFADLASGFTPLANAYAAAHFLRALRAELGGWAAAVAAYHSRTGILGVPYRDRVLAAWHGSPLVTVQDPHVIVLYWTRRDPNPGMGVQVWAPGGALSPLASGEGVPRIIAPGPT